MPAAVITSTQFGIPKGTFYVPLYVLLLKWYYPVPFYCLKQACLGEYRSLNPTYCSSALCTTQSLYLLFQALKRYFFFLFIF